VSLPNRLAIVARRPLKTEDANAVGVEVPFGDSPADEANGAARVGHRMQMMTAVPVDLVASGT
jgi:hypothetical protein